MYEFARLLAPIPFQGHLRSYLFGGMSFTLRSIDSCSVVNSGSQTVAPSDVASGFLVFVEEYKA